MNTVELLAPAGDALSLRGAINAGADAVYLSGKSYGARAFADNFTQEELIDALRQAHLFGVKIYLTVNTLTRQRELPDLIDFVRPLYEAGLDGAIVQDLGAAAALREAFPGLSLHASTQMSVMGPGAVRLLQREGFSRVVPARELALDEITTLKETGVEVETFIHGAMCYSCSGRCLMSSFLGGRSGNRGRCAGTCRLPYEILDEKGRKCPLRKGGEETYPLSMKDLFALPLLPELLDAGIDSFKIEGRMKKPEYAAGVTAVYRKYIDRFYSWDAAGRPGRWEIEPGDLDLLQSLYIRTGLSAGYYHECGGRDLVTIGKPGYRGADPERLEEVRRVYLMERPRRAVRGRAVVRTGRPVSLTVSLPDVECNGLSNLINNVPDGQSSGIHGLSGAVTAETAEAADACCPPHTLSCTVYGPAAQPARQRPLSGEDIRSKLEKTGESPFFFASLEVDTDGDSFLPVSALNELRRRALDGLYSAAAEYPGKAVHFPRTVRTAWNKKDPVPERYFTTGSASAEAVSLEGDSFTPRIFTRRREDSFLSETAPARPLTAAMVMSFAQASAALSSGVDLLILDGPVRDRPEPVFSLLRSLPGRPFLLAALPQLLRDGELPWMESYFRRYYGNFYGFVTRNLEEVEFLFEKEYDKTVVADSCLYCWNRQALDVLRPYCDANILPLELSRKEMEETFRGEHSRMILTVYGRAPLMVSANCVRRTTGRCGRNRSASAAGTDARETGPASSKRPMQSRADAGAGENAPAGIGSRAKESCFYYLKDRTGAVAPVYTDCLHCHNVIYNSVPTLLAGPRDSLMRECLSLLCSFTDESAQETARILRMFREGKAPGGGRKTGQSQAPGGGAGTDRGQARGGAQRSPYTGGHYRRGAE